MNRWSTSSWIPAFAGMTGSRLTYLLYRGCLLIGILLSLLPLSTVWTDPTFKAGQRAFYYARVIENPVCRRNTWDAVRNKLDRVQHLPATIQERVWSSPIWYTPTSIK